LGCDRYGETVSASTVFFNQLKIMLQIIKLKVDGWVARELRVPDMYME